MNLGKLGLLAVLLGVSSHIFCMAGDMIKLESEDGKIFEVSQKAAAFSETLRGFIEMGADDVIPVPNVNSHELSILIQYMNLMQQLTAEGRTDAYSQKHRQFDAILDSMTTVQLFDIYRGANYLDMYLLAQEVAEALAAQVPPQLAYSYDDFGIKRRNFEKIAGELLAGAYDISELPRQTMRETALYLIDPAKSKENTIPEPSETDTKALMSTWLTEDQLDELAPDVRSLLWQMLHDQYTEIQEAMKTQQAIGAYEQEQAAGQGYESDESFYESYR